MVLDDKLKQKGMAREITNKVQKLRKSAGLNIDDQVEIFYTVPKKEGSVLNQVVIDNAEIISSSLRTPFLSAESHLESHFVKIAETDYVNPENENDQVHLIICTPNVSFNTVKLQAKYGHISKTFVNDIKSFVTSYSLDVLRKKAEAHGGKFSFRLNDTEVVLTLKDEFFFSAQDQVISSKK